ncbi:helix-turn-helix transcriptional regulator [Lachnospiraceae bacterium 62-35]
MNDTSIRNDQKILIGSNIKRIRQKRNLKPGELVLKVQLSGVDINIFSLSKIEANIQHIKASQLRAIAKILDVDCMELLEPAETGSEADKQSPNS